MVQTIVNLGDREDRFLNIYKAENGIKSKNEALNKIIRDYEDKLNKEKEDIIFEKRVRESLLEYEKSSDKKKMTKEEFLREIDEW